MKQLICLFLLMSSVQLTHAGPASGDLKVMISDLGHEHGQVVVDLFRKGDDLFQPAYLSQSSVIENLSAVAVFKDLPYGEYALIVYHDENSNRRLDHNLFNLPAEPIGFSGHYQFSFFSGMPSFDTLRFDFNVKQFQQHIQIED